MSVTRAIWVRQGGALYPASDAAITLLRSLKPNQEVLVSVRTVRSLRQLRLYWGLMKILVDHDVFPTIEAATDVIKIASGHCEMRVAPNTGEVYMIPKSIAFESLPHAEFTALFQIMIEIVCDRWIVGVSTRALQREIYAALDGPARIGERVIK